MATRDLTPKQQRFVEEYLIDLNASDAARRAGYSEASAGMIGYQNLQKPEIADAIAELKHERSLRTQISADQVLQEIARLGFSDIRNVLSDNGSLLNPHEWDDQTAASIASIEVVTNTGELGKDEDGRTIVEQTHKIKIWDKNAALEKLCKHLGLYAPEKKDVALKVEETSAKDELEAFLEKVAPAVTEDDAQPG